ncbi:MAG: hypothetical protein IT463_09890 [Planctomycetes bacterium]|nr:hypothetical protein [Planctomycetota bacterium]
MADQAQGSAVEKFGPLGAPAAGGVLAAAFVAVALLGGNISEERGKLETGTRTVNSRMADTKTANPASIPAVDSVSKMFEVEATPLWTNPGNERKGIDYPMGWKVVVAEKDQDPFTKADKDKDGFWSKDEFEDTEYYNREGMVGKFENWDRNPKDNKISPAEFADPPADEQEMFNKLDKNGDGFLTAPDEVTSENVQGWDRGPLAAPVSFEEYKQRHDAKAEVNLGPVTGVSIAPDFQKMEIVVTWAVPQLEATPDDLCYFIERYAPKTLEQRKREYGKVVQKFNQDLAAWEKRFGEWYTANKDSFPDKRTARAEYAKQEPEPAKPPEPADWELVTTTPVTGTEYRDTTFEPDVTYTYAVRAATQKQLVRAQQKYGDRQFCAPYVATERVAQGGRPALVRNDIAMAWAGSAGDDGTIALTRWVRLADGTWAKATIDEKVSTSSTNVGGNYGATELKDRGFSLKRADGTAVDQPLAQLAERAKIDFATGFRFVTKTGAGFLLNRADLGDYELPKDTRQPMGEEALPAGDNPIELRVAALTSKGEATFELTRWVQAGGRWYRVLYTTKVKKDGAIGEAMTGLAKPGIRVMDDADKEVPASGLKVFDGMAIDLAAGNYEGPAGRTVKVSGAALDLFGVMYK